MPAHAARRGRLQLAPSLQAKRSCSCGQCLLPPSWPPHTHTPHSWNPRQPLHRGAPPLTQPLHSTINLQAWRCHATAPTSPPHPHPLLSIPLHLYRPCGYAFLMLCSLQLDFLVRLGLGCFCPAEKRWRILTLKHCHPPDKELKVDGCAIAMRCEWLRRHQVGRRQQGMRSKCWEKQCMQRRCGEGGLRGPHPRRHGADVGCRCTEHSGLSRRRCRGCRSRSVCQWGSWRPGTLAP
jgi:hypothetical protein